ncbi:hypothetical protein BDN70DRAFT_152963 [Pholiota conissans]|uniref:Secreted protein n=1 Tax=Pholiota conissans TaxID=109636 RepID=A0A9P5YY07_9AGAR|nr:hypothetical protein BDN70DRAFT_152963 [Pholiota conissans]
MALSRLLTISNPCHVALLSLLVLYLHAPWTAKNATPTRIHASPLLLIVARWAASCPSTLHLFTHIPSSPSPLFMRRTYSSYIRILKSSLSTPLMPRHDTQRGHTLDTYVYQISSLASPTSNPLPVHTIDVLVHPVRSYLL